MTLRKISIIFIGIIYLVSLGSALETNINQPVDGQQFENNDQLEIELLWESTTDIDSNTLEKSKIILDHPSQTFTKNITRGSKVDSGETVTYSHTISSDQLGSPEDGLWSLTVQDFWEKQSSGGLGGSLGEPQSTANIDIEIGSFGNTELSITNPEEFTNYDRESDLKIEWISENNYNKDQNLISDLEIVDDSGNTWQDSIDQGNIESGSEIQTTETYSASEFNNLNDGNWTLTITNNWDKETSQESVSFEAESTPKDPSGSVSLNVDLHSSESLHNFSDDLLVEWSSTNDYNVEQELAESEIIFEDESGITESTVVSVGENISSGDSLTNSYTVSSSVWGALSPGNWSVSVEDSWEYRSASESVEVEFVDRSDSGDSGSDDTVGQGNYSIGVSSPSSGSSFDYDSGEVGVEWTSSNDGGSSRELIESSVIFEGGAGLTEIDSIDRGEFVSSADSVSSSVTYDSSTWESLEPGAFTLTVKDNWEDGDTVEESVDVSIDSETDSSQDPDNSIDDSTDEDTNSSDSGSDSTDDSSDGDSSNDQNEEGSDGEDNDCPEGFSWDDGVCVEDSGDSSDSDSDDSDESTDGNEGSTDNSDSPNDDSSDDESSTDDQNSDGINGDKEDTNTSMLQQEVAAGISLQTVLLGLLAAMTSGLLFKRSSYTLKF